MVARRGGAHACDESLPAPALALEVARSWIECRRQTRPLGMPRVPRLAVGAVGDAAERHAALPISASQAAGQLRVALREQLCRVLCGHGVDARERCREQERIGFPAEHTLRDHPGVESRELARDLRIPHLLVVPVAGIVDRHHHAAPREARGGPCVLARDRRQESRVAVVAVEHRRGFPEKDRRLERAPLQEQVEVVDVPVPASHAPVLVLPLVLRRPGVDVALLGEPRRIHQEETDRPHAAGADRHLLVPHPAPRLEIGQPDREGCDGLRLQGETVPHEPVARDHGRDGHARPGLRFREPAHHVLDAARLGDSRVFPGDVPDRSEVRHQRPSGRSGRSARAPSR